MIMSLNLESGTDTYSVHGTSFMDASYKVTSSTTHIPRRPCPLHHIPPPGGTDLPPKARMRTFHRT